MEDHAEIKDQCDALDSKLEEIAADIRNLSFNYNFVEQYSNIDQELYEIYEWYEENREIVKKYTEEREIIMNKLNVLKKDIMFFNNNIQNSK